MITLVASVLLAVVVHVTAMALAARALGIGVLGVSYGLGPRITGVGRVAVRALPIGGYVELKRASDHAGTDAYDAQPIWRQVAANLAGPAALVGFAAATLGADAWPAFYHAFPQIVLGAIGPLSTAQRLLEAGATALAERPAYAFAGIVAAKLAAVNLLPLPTTNGGAILLALGRVPPDSPWVARFALASLPLGLLWASWAVAVVVYVCSSA